jgi:hypothetical protein
MIVYNVTTKVATPLATQWLHWMQTIHIPQVMQTNCFTYHKVMQLLEVDDSEGPTYVVQYFAESKSLYNQYIDKFATALRAETLQKWGENIIAFRSVLQLVN